MPKANTKRAILLVIILSGFMLGVVQLFLLRFEAGDVYPPYSTLRSDPLGSRGFYRALGNLRNTSVQRNYQHLPNLEFTEPSTFFYIGTPVFDSESVPELWIEALGRLTARGGRLILSLLPIEKKPANWRMSTCTATDADESDHQNIPQANEANDPEDAPDSGTKPSESASQPRIGANDSPCVGLQEKWGLTFAFAKKPATKAVKLIQDQTAADLKRLPQTISWHTSVYFDDLDDSWRVIYTAEDRPVIIERSYGNGSLVLSADSYFMSNEALRSERSPELLAWTVGRNSNIVFDETHLGIRKQPGVSSLIKKYRFHWFIFALAVVAILFVWKNSVYFVPPPKNSHDQPEQDVYSNRDSAQGLISLLRRNIPARQLLQTCTHEWRRTFERNQRFSSDQSDPLKSIYARIKTYAAQSKDPVSGYRRISKIISRGRYNE
ncbi:MAG: DUF4350 domain-containing protein [Desulfobacterales bacterium]